MVHSFFKEPRRAPILPISSWVSPVRTSGRRGPFYIRNKYIGTFARITGAARSNLVLNYGLRWDVLPPGAKSQISFRPSSSGGIDCVSWRCRRALCSLAIPNCRVRWLPPNGTISRPVSARPLHPISRTDCREKGRIAPTRAACARATGHVSIPRIKGLSAAHRGSCAPSGYGSPGTVGRPQFDQPFVSATGTEAMDNRSLRPSRAFGASPEPSQHDGGIGQNTLRFTGDPAFYYRNTSPYDESYTFSWERELESDHPAESRLRGSQAHHLLVLTSADPGNAALCLSVSDARQVKAGTPVCGPFSEGGIFTKADGTPVQVRGPFNASFDGITYQKTLGFS